MPRFRFSLDPVLRTRRLAEQGRQRTVAQIERERMELEELLRQQQMTIAQGKASLQHGLVGKIDAQGLRLHAAASIHLMRIAQRIVLELACVHRRLDAARVELLEATRRRRAVELLRQRRFEFWKAAQEKSETAMLDELAGMAAFRDQSAGLREPSVETSP